MFYFQKNLQQQYTMATFETYELGAESELRVEIPTTAELTVRLLLLTACPLFRFFLFFFQKRNILEGRVLLMSCVLNVGTPAA